MHVLKRVLCLHHAPNATGQTDHQNPYRQNPAPLPLLVHAPSLTERGTKVNVDTHFEARGRLARLDRATEVGSHKAEWRVVVPTVVPPHRGAGVIANDPHTVGRSGATLEIESTEPSQVLRTPWSGQAGLATGALAVTLVQGLSKTLSVGPTGLEPMTPAV